MTRATPIEQGSAERSECSLLARLTHHHFDTLLPAQIDTRAEADRARCTAETVQQRINTVLPELGAEGFLVAQGDATSNGSGDSHPPSRLASTESTNHVSTALDVAFVDAPGARDLHKRPPSRDRSAARRDSGKGGDEMAAGEEDGEGEEAEMATRTLSGLVRTFIDFGAAHSEEPVGWVNMLTRFYWFQFKHTIVWERFIRDMIDKDLTWLRDNTVAWAVVERMTVSAVVLGPTFPVFSNVVSIKPKARERMRNNMAFQIRF